MEKSPSKPVAKKGSEGGGGLEKGELKGLNRQEGGVPPSKKNETGDSLMECAESSLQSFEE